MARTKIRVEGDKEQARMVRRALPWVGAALVGGIGAVAAAAIGAGELAVGVMAAYAGYRYLRAGTVVRETGHQRHQSARGRRGESQRAKRAA